jgi:aryl-alcohol dehydrogenase-like predicted oxidoreductase
MQDRKLTRREALLAGAAGVTTLLLSSAAARAAAAAPAAAAGTLSVGGDLSVNRMGFGAMRITGPDIWGEPQDPAQARAVLHRALDLGVNFIDTADAYGPEVSERLIAQALYPYPRGLLIATKGGLMRPSPVEWIANGRPAHLREACEASLKRLKLARIDLYQLHRIDPAVPLEESIGELAKLRQEGKIRHVGVSNFSAEELERARRIVPIASVQNRYNVSDRTSEDVLQLCTRERIVFIPWAPIARGSAQRLEGKEGGGLEGVAQARGVSVLQLAIAWLLAKSPLMLPIPGTSSPEHLEEDIAAARLALTPAEMSRIG